MIILTLFYTLMAEFSKKITAGIEIPSPILNILKKEIKNIFDFKSKIENSLDKNVTELVEIILGGAIVLGTSDIHIEPTETQAKIRIRIDGVLQDILFLEKKVFDNFLSRIKLLSEVKLNITDRPQDGRFSISAGDTSIEIRTSTLPAEYGESIVMRILNPKNLMSLSSLGLREDLLEVFKKEITKPNGMIIVTGPTGAGKTTTLYAFLKELQSSEIKIITIEDPIEYHLEGVSQTQVDTKKGYNFASGLKSIVRQDPDVILVGEIRDLETANIALQAALTGHLVFTTLHTNDAAGTVARLINLGAKPADIGPAVNISVAQRLVRKICDKCAILEKISTDDFEKIKKDLKNLPHNIKIPALTALSKIPKAKGCQECNNTGYRGRLGIFEVLSVDDEIEKFLLDNPSIAALKEKAIENGMISLYQDGLIKVLEGLTTLKEVRKITGE